MTSTVFKDYPYYQAKDINELMDIVGQITHTRKDDITQIKNLPEVFISGRSVGKIPTSSADVVPDDRIGDQSIAADGSYLYILVNNAGAAVWRRVALGSW